MLHQLLHLSAAFMLTSEIRYGIPLIIVIIFIKTQTDTLTELKQDMIISGKVKVHKSI